MQYKLKKIHNLKKDLNHDKLADFKSDVNVINLNGEKVKSINVNENIFNVNFNIILIKEIVEFQQANARQATYGTKNRSELTYSTKKMRAQKGSGRARVGPRGAPQHRKGAVTFGPDGRVYSSEMPKTKKRKALAMCLTKKFQNNNIIFVDNLNFETISTKLFISTCEKLNLDKKTLFVDVDKNKNIMLSMRNVIGYDFLPIIGLNPLSIIKSNKIVITEDALKIMEKRYEN